MANSSGTSIVWFRQDLRLHDQPALLAAMAGDACVLAVYVLDDSVAWPMGRALRWWLHGSLASLAAALKAAGTELVLRRGRAEDIIPELAREAGAGVVHAGIAHEPGWRAIDAKVAQALQADGRTLALHRTSSLIDFDAVRSKTGTVYGMYTPFANAVEALGEPGKPEPAPTAIKPVSMGRGKQLASDRLDEWALLPTRPDWAGGMRETWVPGEQAAAKRLALFVGGAVARYGTGRNLPGEDGTSMLSPHLHFGELSPRTIWHASRTEADGQDHHTYRRELIWRDFSAYLLWHHPTLPEAPLRPAFARLANRDDAAGLRAWQRGMTGVPIVDAGMRQLWQTGWMHNRVRMITASFLVKHLLIAWQAGSAWFWDKLVDADLASNSASWQWVAGTGIDAQPFFRVFNPVTQGEKFDADGGYVRRFVPELARLPHKYVHAPWTASASILAAAGVVLGRDYPELVVDLNEGRNRALDVYRRTVREAAA
jgi:deoxyribodipyrimidine photo-lyase